MLRQKPFRTLWIAQFVSIFGDFLALFAVISLITFRLHGTAIQVMAVSLAYLLPMTIIAPVAGVLVDRWNVKRVMIASDLIRGVLILLLVLARDVPQICFIFAALAVLSSFFLPAQLVTLKTLVSPEDLLAANALLSQAFYAVRVLSPIMAGVVVVWLTERVCFLVGSLGFFASTAMISTLAIPQRPAAERNKTLPALASDFLVGNRFIFTHTGMTFVFTASAMGMFILSVFNPLIAIYVRDSLSAGPVIYGIVRSIVGVGMILGTQSVNRLTRNSSPMFIVFSGLVTLGVSAALLGVFANIPMATFSSLFLGIALALVLVPSQTLAQQETPHDMMGRVTSTFVSLMSLAQIVGLLFSGYLVQILGIRRLFVACSIALGILAAGGYRFMRARIALSSLQPFNPRDDSSKLQKGENLQPQPAKDG
jgi:DHA3 family macrolide efflux protein-like MFS transporter